MRQTFVLLLLAALALPALAGEERFAPALIEPAAGQQLQAGSTSMIAWSAASTPPDVEEWEAFVSFDGGQTYPTRLTPHLGSSIRRFAWRVPNLPAAGVTIMLRFGDEHHERRFVFPQQGRITGVATLLQTLSLPSAIASPAPGEPAEAGGEGVTEWVESARDGSGVRTVSSAAGREIGASSLWASRAEQSPAAIARSGDEAAVARSIVIADVLPHRRPPRLLQREPRAPDVLLNSTRLNI